jgi:predicted Zn-dependent peptidase
MTRYHVTRLASGLTVATAEMPQMASVSIGLWMGIGSRYEPEELNGVCHFIEHLLFKGTRKRSAREISQAVEGIGGYLNAFTSEEVTCFHARAGARHLDVLLDVLMDMFLRSRFAPADVVKEREVIKEEVAMYRDQPQHYVHELLNATMWPRQPLGRPITGTRRSLDRISRAHLLNYMRGHYLARNAFIVAAGNLKHAPLVKAAKRYARFFAAGKPPVFSSVAAEQKQPKVRLFTRKTEQTQIALGIRTCSRHDRRRYAIRLLNTILGENMSSRLFQVVREDRGLAYSIYSTPSFFADTGDLVISAGLDHENVEKVIRIVVRELRHLCDSPPGAPELRRARDYVIGQIDLGLEGTENQMNWAGEQLIGYGRIIPPEQIRKRLREITPSEIRAVARDFFRPERLNLAMVSPLESATTLARLLAQGL